MSFEGLLDERVTIERAAAAGAPTGVQARTWAVVATGVATAIQPPRGGLVQREFGRRDEASALAFFAVGVPLSAGDRVVRADGSRWEARLVASVRGHHLEAELRRVEPG